MKYKDNAVNRISQLDASVARIVFQLNRREPLDSVLNSLEALKSQIEELRQMVELEPQDFR